MAEGCAYDFQFLYRILRADEHPVEYGITAVSPFAKAGMQRHILHGTSTKSKFISTGASLEGILKFARKTKTRPIRIAVINFKTLKVVENVSIYNLNDKTVRQQYLKSERAIQFVENTKEVLIVGGIPAECVNYVAEKTCQYQYLHRLLRTGEEPLSNGIKAKDATSSVTVEDYILKGTSIASQFIATCASREAVERFADNATNARKSVAKINARKLEEAGKAIFIDLTCDDDLSLYCKRKTAKDIAWKYQVVLIVGIIPKDCIDSILAI